MSWGKIILLKNKLEIRSISFQKAGKKNITAPKALAANS